MVLALSLCFMCSGIILASSMSLRSTFQDTKCFGSEPLCCVQGNHTGVQHAGWSAKLSAVQQRHPPRQGWVWLSHGIEWQKHKAYTQTVAILSFGTMHIDDHRRGNDTAWSYTLLAPLLLIGRSAYGAKRYTSYPIYSICTTNTQLQQSATLAYTNSIEATVFHQL